MSINPTGKAQAAVDFSLEEQKKKQELVEKILAAISHATEMAKNGTLDDANKARDTLISLQGNANAEQLPILNKAIDTLTVKLDAVSPKASSGKSYQRQMNSAQATRAEFVTTPAPKNISLAAATAVATAAAAAPPYQPLPAPSLPPSKAPSNSTVPNGALWLLQDPLSTMKGYFEYLNAHPTDPTAMMNLMNFIGLLSSSGKMTPAIEKMLAKHGDLVGDGSHNGGIDMWSHQMADYAYFAGYNGVNGQTGMTNYLNDLLSHLQGIPNPNKFIAEMIADTKTRITEISAFTTAHTAANGDLICTYQGAADASGNPDVATTYDWTNPGTSTYNDQDAIMSIINGQASGGTPNPFVTNMDLLGMEQDYRVSALNQLLKEFKDPLMAITLWMLQSDDNQTESKISGENENTDILTKATNVFANDMTDAFAAFGGGTGTGADVLKLARSVFGAHVFFDQNPQLAGIQSQFNTSVYNGILNLDGGTLKSGLISAMQNPTTDNLNAIALTLNGFLGTQGTTPNPVFQQTVNITTQLTGLSSGQSKTISTEQGNDISTLAAFIKTADAVLSLQKMFEKVIQNFHD